MNWESASDTQLMTILSSDKDIPTHLAVGLSEELIKRDLWTGILIYTAKRVYKNADYVIRHCLKMDWQEFFHIGHIEIMEQAKHFKPGMRTLKTFMIMCLISKAIKLRREAAAEKRAANVGADDVDGLEEKVRERIFQSHVNVERTVVNKLMLESGWKALRENERKAIILEQEGYSQYEISEMLGYNKTTGNKLLKCAYAKMRKQMGA